MIRLRVNMIACDGRGLCAEVLPELISLDDWGFPIITAVPTRGRPTERPGFVPEELQGQAGEAVRLCPRLALRLER
jgi:ferredoxin